MRSGSGATPEQPASARRRRHSCHTRHSSLRSMYAQREPLVMSNNWNRSPQVRPFGSSSKSKPITSLNGPQRTSRQNEARDKLLGRLLSAALSLIFTALPSPMSSVAMRSRVPCCSELLTSTTTSLSAYRMTLAALPKQLLIRSSRTQANLPPGFMGCCWGRITTFHTTVHGISYSQVRTVRLG